MRSTRRSALARFALFEGVRLNLIVLARWFPHETTGVGLRHAFVLGDVSRNALDQRIKRARVKSKVALARRRPALIDLLREASLAGVR